MPPPLVGRCCRSPAKDTGPRTVAGSFAGKLLHQQVATPDVAVVDAPFYLERPVGSHAPHVLGLDEGARPP